MGPPKSSESLRAAVAAFCALGACFAFGQSMNLDVDDIGAPPEAGGGPPSDAFGAAAGQPGRWNSVPLGVFDWFPLVGLGLPQHL